jgi:hypothetical protein
MKPSKEIGITSEYQACFLLMQTGLFLHKRYAGILYLYSKLF